MKCPLLRKVFSRQKIKLLSQIVYITVYSFNLGKVSNFTFDDQPDLLNIVYNFQEVSAH